MIPILSSQEYLTDLLVPSAPEARGPQDALAFIDKIKKQATSYQLVLQMLGPDPFLDLLYAGMTVAEIARKTGIPHRLMHVFIRGIPDAYEAQLAGAEAMVDNATEMLERANQDTLSVNKAQADHNKWVAERVNRKQWGRNISEDAIPQAPFQLNWVLADGVTVTPEQLSAMGYGGTAQDTVQPSVQTYEQGTVQPSVQPSEQGYEQGTEVDTGLSDYDNRLIPVEQVTTTNNMIED